MTAANSDQPYTANRSEPLALLEVLDRDGQVRQAIPVRRWPVRVGRALDNDLILSDPHVAPQHLQFGLEEDRLTLFVGETCNGVQLGDTHYATGATHALGDADAAAEMVAGSTRLRLRLPQDPLVPELPLNAGNLRTRRVWPVAAAALGLLLGMLFNTYLDTDPEGLGRAVGSMLLSSVAGGAVWCGAWALLSKTFTRQARFGWHFRVFVWGSCGLLAIEGICSALAFSLSWAWLSDFSFVGVVAVGAVGLYFHLLAVEPARHRGLLWAAAAFAMVGIALTLWFNSQRVDQWGEELYMTHLLPPAARLAKPVSTDAFIDGLARLKPVLDKKSQETSPPDGAGTAGESEE